MSKKILVVEDEKRMNEIITDYLEMEEFQVYQAYDGVEALKIFHEEAIDLVILDIMMPKLDGWSVCRKIRSTSDAMVIILSARSDEDDKLMGFELGADEYVTKPFSPKVLVARVKALLKRMGSKQPIDGEIRKGHIRIDPLRYDVFYKDIEVKLTVKEFEVLKVLAENDGKVFTRQVLIEKVWGYEYFGDGRVVDTTIKTLRKKLGQGSVYITTVIGVGYKFEVKA